MRKLIYLSIVIGLVSASNLYSAPVDNKLIKLGETRFSVDNFSCYTEAVATDSEGNIFVVGGIYNEQDVFPMIEYDFLTLKYDANLVLKSSVTAAGAGIVDNNKAHDIAIDSAGNVFVAGETGVPSGSDNAFIVKYSNDLSFDRRMIFGSADNYRVNGIAFDKTPQEHIIITGDYKKVEKNSELFIQSIANDLVTYEPAVYYASGTMETHGMDVVVDSDNDIFVTGYNRNQSISSLFTFLTLKFPGGITGFPLKADFNADQDNGRGFGIAIGPDNGVLVTGRNHSKDRTEDFYTIKYSNDLADPVVAILDGPGSGQDQAYSVAIDGDGNVFVTGHADVTSDYSGCTDILTVKYDKGMNIVATAVFNTDYSGYGGYYPRAVINDVAVDKDGNVIVVGSSNKVPGAEFYDIVAIKYLGRATNPTITSASVTVFKPGKTYDMVLTGTDLFPGLEVESDSPAGDIIINSIVPNSTAQVTVNLTVKTGAAPGSYYLTVKNIDGESFTLSPAYRVVVPSDDIIPEGAGVDLVAGTGKVKVQGGANGYVNPAKGEQLVLHYRASAAGSVVLKIFTVRGQLVRELTEETIGDEDEITWDCKNADESTVSSGLYVCYLSGPGINKTNKVAVLK